MPDKAEDIKYMSLALTLAKQGQGKTLPNPMVGAVIVKNNRIIGRGYHRAYGKEHAETAAIKDVRGDTKGATLYVNLEPCCHTGNTGPCTDAIIKSKIKRVVIASKDPNPMVNGKGTKLIKKAGIDVKTGVLKDASFKLNDAYLSYHKNKRPFIILKLAQSLDGRIAAVTGESKYISSKESLKLTHKIRSEVDAVVIGGGTFRNDNPSLTVRHIRGKKPYRIVLSQSIKMSNKFNLIKNNSDSKTIIAATEKNIQHLSKSHHGKNMIYWVINKNKNGQLDLHDFIRKADAFGIRSIMVEGGAAMATSFLKAKLIDKLILITTPIIIGDGINTVNDLQIKKLNNVISFKMTENYNSGGDNIFIGYPNYR